MPEWVALVLTVVLLAANGGFVAAEFALVSARRSVVEPWAESGSRRAVTTLHAIENLSLMMAGAQLGITVCSLALGSLSEPAIAHLLEPVFTAVALPEAAVHPVAFVIALGLVTVLHVVLGEMVPKNVALAGPERAALWLAPPLAGVVRVLKPLIWSLNRLANLAVRTLRVTPRTEVVSAFTRDEVADMVAESHREGLLDPDEHDLLTGAIGFVARRATAVVLPTDRLATVPADVTPDRVEALCVASGYSRFPLADLSGYLHVKDVTTLADRTAPVPAALVRPLPRVEADARLRAVFEMMRREATHLVAATRDGVPVGVIALEDVVEELVGEVRDVHATAS